MMKKSFGRYFALIALIAVAGVVLFACGQQQEQAADATKEAAPAEKMMEMIKLGVAGAHSGDLASYGIPTVRAAELIVKKRNAMTGVCGRQIELLVEDDVCKPEVATNTATKLVTDGANVVVGTSAAAPPKRPWGFTRNPVLLP
jgi:ABC-type branched-subunit amino acid transport system substrate-binding protein